MPNAANPSDPTDAATGMLDRIGRFIEPLTRFDRSQIELRSCTTSTLSVTATQQLSPRLDRDDSRGAGRLPDNVRSVSGPDELEREIDAMRSRAEAAVATRLQSWASSRGADPGAIPDARDLFTGEGRIGYAWRCQSCDGSGHADCSTCEGAGKTRCGSCAGSGHSKCSHCGGSGERTCESCGGHRQHSRQVPKYGWNSVTNEKTVTYETVWEPCYKCRGQGKVQCEYCHGSGKTMCFNCGGSGTTTCLVCQGSGNATCRDCEGRGQLHLVSSIGCCIDQSVRVRADGADPEPRTELAGLTDIGQLLALADGASVRSECSERGFTRVTTARVRMASAGVEVAGRQLRINGYGPNCEIFDFKDMGAALLAGDIEALETALSKRKGLVSALAGMLASETHAEIARRSGPRSRKKRTAAMRQLSRENRGVASPEYALRASNAIRKGIGRLYRRNLLLWPVLILTLPALALPVNYLSWRSGNRDQDLPVFLGAMILTLAAAYRGHRWAAARMQRQLAPAQGLKMTDLVNGQGRTWRWLILVAVLAFMLTAVSTALGRVWAGF